MNVGGEPHMKVLVISPTQHHITELVQSWKSRLSEHDRLSILVCAGSGKEEVNNDVHFLELNPLEPQIRHRILLRAFIYLPWLTRPFWREIVREIWAEFYWNVQSFDPDLVDLRLMPGGQILKSKLKKHNDIVVLASGDKPLRKLPHNSRRRYDPNVKVSIVLPVHNGARYLKLSIESCLAQTHQNLELVVVDDCSTDETPEIISEFTRCDSRTIGMRNPRNLGLPSSLNTGFSHTHGELLTWTSHDNFYAQNAIEELVRFLCTWNDVDFVYSAYRNVDERGTVVGTHSKPPMPWQLSLRNIVGPCFLYRRRVYEELGEYRQDMEYVEDYEYWLRVFSRFRMMRLSLPLYYYRRHPKSMTARKRNGIAELTRKVQHEHIASR